MKKHKSYIISSLLTIIALFTTAAACNLFGVPIEIGEEQQITAETKKDTEVKVEKNPVERAAVKTSEPEESKNENHKPVIEKVTMSGKDVKILETEGTLEKVLIRNFNFY